jgi:hypothetical protein
MADNAIWLDHDAAGFGWFIDSTPLSRSVGINALTQKRKRRRVEEDNSANRERVFAEYGEAKSEQEGASDMGPYGA